MPCAATPSAWRGTIVKLFRIAETATKHDERRAFKELLAYAKKHADELTGLLFYKVDRAARNLFDYVELERLESEHGLEFISRFAADRKHPGRSDATADAREHGEFLHRTAIA